MGYKHSLFSTQSISNKIACCRIIFIDEIVKTALTICFASFFDWNVFLLILSSTAGSKHTEQAFLRYQCKSQNVQFSCIDWSKQQWYQHHTIHYINCHQTMIYQKHEQPINLTCSIKTERNETIKNKPL